MTYTTPFTEFPTLTSSLEKCPVPVFVRNCSTKQYHVFTAPGYGALICDIPCFIQGDSRHGGYYHNIAGRLCSENFSTLRAAKKDFYLKMADYVTGPRRESVVAAMEMLIAAMTGAEPAPVEPAPAPAPEPEQPTSATKRAQPDFVGKKMIAWPRQPKPDKPKKPDFVGRKMTAWPKRAKTA